PDPMHRRFDRAEKLEQLRRRWEALAREAWQLGEAAFVANELDAAARWLDRARRLAPGSATVALTLATVWQRQGRGEAEQLFETLAREHDVRPAWLGLAA